MEQEGRQNAISAAAAEEADAFVAVDVGVSTFDRTEPQAATWSMSEERIAATLLTAQADMTATAKRGQASAR